ncbi:DJ-1 family glyoxalase III [Terasakiispira papahanaumokuakeensis]|nr:DJ-1 family glyoxalase III [Terasakiispira papahanaumokuakeensis]
MMQAEVLLLIANGSEDLESVTIIDVLRRANIPLLLTSIEDNVQVTCARGTRIEADICLDALDDAAQYPMLVLPGGVEGAERLAASVQVQQRVKYQVSTGRVLAAICAAPALVLGEKGFLSGKAATCYPRFAERLGVPWQNAAVVEDGALITAQGPGSALAFALTLVTRLRDHYEAERIASEMLVSWP